MRKIIRNFSNHILHHGKILLLFCSLISLNAYAYWGNGYVFYMAVDCDETRPFSGVTKIVGDHILESCQDLLNNEPQYSACRVVHAQFCAAQAFRSDSPCTNNQVKTEVGGQWQCKDFQGENNGKPTCEEEVGNPINLLIGNKYQEETDFSGVGLFPLTYKRSYNSATGIWYSLPVLSFQLFDEIAQDRVLYIPEGLTTGVYLKNGFEPEELFITDADGKNFQFVRVSGNWGTTSNQDISIQEIRDTAGVISHYQYKDTSDRLFLFDLDGRILSVTDPSGIAHTYTYSDNDIQVKHSNDQELIITRDSTGAVTSVLLPDGESINYQYDTEDRLATVTYPDDTPGNSADNPQRIYHYEDTNVPSALTGITDEQGNRFATWTYDAAGRAISSEHANGVAHQSLDYGFIEAPADPRITVTNELGKDTTYHYATLHGVRKVVQVEGHASANCAAANQNYTYDANGFLDEVTDWEGNVTDYNHDARGLEIQRIEAKGTPQERTITTQWHADYRLPIKITEPDRVIDFTYNASGQLLERKETPVTP